MFRTLLSFAILSAASLPALALPDRHGDKEHRKEWKKEDKEDRRFWRERDKAERKYWKEREKQSRQYERHRYHDDDDDDDDHRPRARRHRAPSWMHGYWRQDDTRRYVALVPGDPSRMYVFLEGRWVLRQIRDPRARLDLEGAFRLPVAPPPIAPPRIGLDLHVVLFD